MGCSMAQLNAPVMSSHLGNAGTSVAESVQVLDDIGAYPSSKTAERQALPLPESFPSLPSHNDILHSFVLSFRIRLTHLFRYLHSS